MATDVSEPVAIRARRPAMSERDPILAAKIAAPGTPGWAVPRPRITELLAQGTRWCPLTVVTGPPGAGKTTALALWAAAEPGAVAWVRLDRYDNRPGAFWSYVVAALRRSGVVIPDVPSAGARGRAADHVFLLWLVSALAAQDPPVSLVLDDFHVLTEPHVLRGLDFVLRNVGSGLRLVISSRMDPLLPLHRYRVAGQLTEIRAGDLAFSVPEAGLLMSQHGMTVPADSLASLTTRTEGWAAGLRLAAISMGTHPEPDHFVKELITEDSALTGYLMEEVLSTQPPEVRDFLLSTSILEHVSAEAASELLGDEQARGILQALARANTFIQPIGCGWYRYHTLFAEVLRLKLRCEYPERVPGLHRRAARVYERRGSLIDAVRHAAEARDWPLAAGMVIRALAISEITEPHGSRCLADEFLSMPDGEAWPEPQPYLVSAAAALAAGQHESSVAAVGAAEAMLGRLPPGEEAPSRLAATMIRLAVARRTGDLAMAAESTARAEAIVRGVPDGKLARHPKIRAHVLAGRGYVELWSGHLEEAVRVLNSALAAATASGAEYVRADCLAHLAVAEAVHGSPGHAAELAAQAATVSTAGERPNPAALVALAWVHAERAEMRDARSFLQQADAALGARPDKLIGTLAGLVAACLGLAEGHAAGATRCVARARSGWQVPAWLEQRLSHVEARAYVLAGDIRAALAAAGRIDCGSSLEAAVMHAQTWTAAGHTSNARRALAPALAVQKGMPERLQMHVWLADAQLSYDNGDGARGHRSLASALRLAEHEQLRLPFVLEHGWIRQVLRHDAELARSYQRLLNPALRGDQPAAPAAISHPQDATDQPAVIVVDRLTERELEVLRHVSGMLNTAEVAGEMYISVNTVKTHLKSIYRKLAATHRGEAVRRARQLELI